MDVKVHDPDDALAIESDQALERVGRIQQPLPGELGEIGR
jgi:hypothetical protein